METIMGIEATIPKIKEQRAVIKTGTFSNSKPIKEILHLLSKLKIIKTMKTTKTRINPISRHGIKIAPLHGRYYLLGTKE
jgi:hypothetical protein